MPTYSISFPVTADHRQLSWETIGENRLSTHQTMTGYAVSRGPDGWGPYGQALRVTAPVTVNVGYSLLFEFWPRFVRPFKDFWVIFTERKITIRVQNGTFMWGSYDNGEWRAQLTSSMGVGKKSIVRMDMTEQGVDIFENGVKKGTISGTIPANNTLSMEFLVVYREMDFQGEVGGLVVLPTGKMP